MLQVNFFQDVSTVVPSARVSFIFGDHEDREYLDCYASHTANGLVLIRSYQEPPSSLARAVFNAEQVFVEHFGSHPAVPSPSKQRKERLTASEGDVVRLPVKEVVAVAMGGPEAAEKMQHGMTPEEVVEENLNKAWAEFKQDSTPAQDQPDTKAFLESDHAAPKEEASSTGEAAGSDRMMLETPSGEFMVKMPLEPTEEEVEARKTALAPELKEAIETFGIPDEPSTLGPDMNSTPASGTFDNRATRRAKKHGGHGRPKQLPGATLLVALALSLSVYFRHPA